MPGNTIHHSDAGSQYTSVHFGETLALGMRPSIGTVGDAFDNALAETTIGLYKTECTRAGSPFRPARSHLSDIEYVTADCVAWYNHHRLMHRLGDTGRAEAEYYARHVTDRPVGSHNPEGAPNPGWFTEQPHYSPTSAQPHVEIA